MAKHRQQENRRASSAKQTTRKRRRSPSLILLGTTAAALSTVLVFGHATNNTVDSPAGATRGLHHRHRRTRRPNAAKIPNKLNRHVVPNGFTYIPVNYPAAFDIDNSVAAGVPVLDQTIKQSVCDDPADCPFLLVVGYSEGATRRREGTTRT